VTEIVRKVSDLHARVARWHSAGDIVGLVPTMGALHAGHLSLVRAAQADCARVIATIFVNPKQFNNPADLAKYPRTEAADLALLQQAGVDVLFAPPPEEVYPLGFATTVSVAGVAGPLEGASRPGHFDGVATVVAKLFGMSRADRAYFGQKDWQQLQVVRRMVADLNLPITVIGCETLREGDGLAMSSRNTRLSPRARAIAPALYAAMTRAASDLRAGKTGALKTCAATVLAAGFDSIDYIDLRDADSLQPLTAPTSTARLLAAAWLDGVRLIDNIPV
jgi:pantoate--beta-alanine ligase